MTARSLRAEPILLGLGLFSLAMILGALGFQYLGHLAPCEMCHWQRWPHIATAVLGLVVAPLWNRPLRLPLAGLAILVAVLALIAGWRAGMLNIWPAFPVWQLSVLTFVIIALTAGSFALVLLALGKANPNLLAAAAITLVLLSGLIGLYQGGMLIGWLPGPQACTVSHPYIMGSNVAPVVQCDAPHPVLFGLSLPFYNASLSIAAALAAALFLRRNHAA